MLALYLIVLVVLKGPIRCVVHEPLSPESVQTEQPHVPLYAFMLETIARAGRSVEDSRRIARHCSALPHEVMT